MLRPARVGLLTARADLADVDMAVCAATSSWGGLYFPIVDVSGQGDHERHLEALSVDVLWPLTDNATAVELARQPGFRWIGMLQRSPFDPSDDSLTTRVLASDWLIGRSRMRMALPEWSNDDPLAALFGVWFGRFSSDDDGQARRKRFAENAEVINVGVGESLTSTVNVVTPICLTKMEIDYCGDSPGVGIVVVDPSEASDLLRFWNLRASGADVMPWVIGYESVVQPVIRRWVQLLIDQGRLTNVRHGDGRVGPPKLVIWTRESDRDVNDFPLLQDFLREYDLVAWPGHVFVRGWHGHHPLNTEFTRSFNTDVDTHAGFVTIPLPTLPWVSGRRPSRWPGIAAADIGIHSERGLDPERTTVAPRVRRLSKLLHGRAANYESFQRPTGAGWIYGVHAAAETVQVALVRPLEVIEGLFDQPNWKFSQSDDGRFATRLGQLLGGIESTAANQPAIRETLIKAAMRHDAGIPFPALRQTAQQYRGSWPTSSDRRSPDEYARDLLLWLLQRKLLRTVLPLTCPSCRSVFVIDPDDLATDMQCGFCDHRFPLALAVAWAGPKSDWRYRIAGHVSESRLRAALPVLAVTSVLSSLAIGRQPQSAGTTITTPSRKAEFDIATVANPFIPEVVLGEVKSHGPIDGKDVDNLVWAQKQLRNKHVECFILIATLNNALNPDEILLLRQCCMQSPEPLRSDGPIEPLLPIVLTHRDLSNDQFSDDYPFTWKDPGRGLSGLALASCKRNLGLIETKIVPRNDTWTHEFIWK
jgi:hypothetical protein